MGLSEWQKQEYGGGGMEEIRWHRDNSPHEPLAWTDAQWWKELGFEDGEIPDWALSSETKEGLQRGCGMKVLKDGSKVCKAAYCRIAGVCPNVEPIVITEQI